MFRGPRDYNKLDLKKFTGHKDEVSIFESKKKPIMTLMIITYILNFCIPLLSHKPKTLKHRNVIFYLWHQQIGFQRKHLKSMLYV